MKRAAPTQLPGRFEAKAFDLWLGRSLRAMFDTALHEELPDELLRRLPSAGPAG